jgi:hypothetical protein
MQISLTWGDVLITLVVTVVATIVVTILMDPSKYMGAAKTRVAGVFETTARKRIASLRSELTKIDEYTTDPARHAAWNASMLARLSMESMVAIMFMVLLVGDAITMDVQGLFTILDANLTTRYLEQQTEKFGRWSRLFYPNDGLLRIMSLALAVVFLKAMLTATLLMSYTDLKRRKDFIQKQIDRLVTRWGESQ